MVEEPLDGLDSDKYDNYWEKREDIQDYNFEATKTSVQLSD